jgi:hypothetical protein
MSPCTAKKTATTVHRTASVPAPKGLTPSIIHAPLIEREACHELPPEELFDRRFIRLKITTGSDGAETGVAITMTRVSHIAGNVYEHEVLSVDAFSEDHFAVIGGLFDWCRAHLEDMARARRALVDAGCAS